jgi:hypothetical protein
MDATTNFSLRFAQASESKVRMADRLGTRQTSEKIGIALSLISHALGFSIFGTLITANRHQADLNGFGGGSFVAVVSGFSAMLVGAACLSAAGIYWRLCAGRSAGLAVSRKTVRLNFAKPESITTIPSLA